MNRHKSCVLWFTGLSGSGKSTLANEVEQALFHRQIRTYVLDGDNIRHRLNRDLGFSKQDRAENIRRVGELSRLFVDAGVIALTAIISPSRAEREKVRALFEPGEFIEVYVSCPLEVCEQRDPKGLYRRARAGQIRQFTGVSAPYEAPVQPELIVDTHTQSVQQAVELVIAYLESRGYIPSDPAQGHPDKKNIDGEAQT